MGAKQVEVDPGRLAQPISGPVHRRLWPTPSTVYLKPWGKGSCVNPFAIHRRGAQKLEGHHSGEEGRASCLGFP
jgi:hypothetical protein